MKNLKIWYKEDLLSGLVVFLVALPLCLGIAVASGASPIAGIISGIVGGIVVGSFSNSHVSVTGPAAGLIAIVLASVTEIGYESFLVAVIIAGVIQFLLGLSKAGTISSYFPTSVIEGMLMAIGLIIIKKELPHAIGYDLENEGDFFSYSLTKSDFGFWTEMLHSFNYAHLGAIIITLFSLGILIAFNKVDRLKKIKLLPGALVVVLTGICLNQLFLTYFPELTISKSHLVNIPVTENLGDLLNSFIRPDFKAIQNPNVWMTGLTIAIVASIETLLCLEAGDKLDHHKRFSNANIELKAQGTGNIISGLIGGLPVTSVIVRTTANINAGAKSKFSAIFHGVLLLFAALLIPAIVNMIPMASLASILIMTGVKLANINLFKKLWVKGMDQFLPFVVTVIAVFMTDLLKGVGLGLIISLIYILRTNLKTAYFFRKEMYHTGDTIHIDLAQEVSFLNKAAIKETLSKIPTNTALIIDASAAVFIDHDVMDLIREFEEYTAKEKRISLSLIGFKDSYHVKDSTHVYAAQ